MRGINFLFKKNPSLSLKNFSGNNDCLIAGPFLGEFGWELMQWQGYIRQLSKFYKYTIVYGRASSEYFYKDFVNEFRIMDEASWDTDAYLLKNFNYIEWAKQFQNKDIIIADNRCKELQGLMHQDFIKFGKKIKKNEFDLIIHARHIPTINGNEKKAKRNWLMSSWDNLCKSLPHLKIAAVGVKELSYAPRGIEDLRGISTKKLCSILASSKCCVGPSSGLMHLASLCKTPHLVWTSEHNGSKRFGGVNFRYQRSWNPHSTEVKIINKEGDQPSYMYVQKEILKFLSPKK
jgi:hypothetical protein